MALLVGLCSHTDRGTFPWRSCGFLGSRLVRSGMEGGTLLMAMLFSAGVVLLMCVGFGATFGFVLPLEFK